MDNRGNRILNALPAGAREQIMVQAASESLQVKTVLFEPGEAISHVHFPIGSVISLVTQLENNNMVEVATIGNEGIVGVPLRAKGALAVRAITSVAGTALRLDADAFTAELGRNGPLRDLVQNYTRALFGQISQAVACNRLHSNEERLSCWLLLSRDRVGRDEFDLEHEFLAQILGSRPSAVILSAGILEAAGLIRYRRGRVTIRDHVGLREESCECYGAIRALFEPSAPMQRSAPARRRH